MDKKYEQLLTKSALETDYKQFRNVNELARKYDVNSHTIRAYMKYHNIDFKRYRKYEVNETFFDQDTQEAFYVAGFFAADGNISIMEDKRYHNITYPISLGLKEADRDLLDQIKSYIYPDGTTYKIIHKDSLRNERYNDSISYEFKFSSKIVFDSLQRFGIGPKKSLTLKFPEWIIDHKLAHHFIRGYFDGDGSICIPNKVYGRERTQQKQIHIRGTEEFLRTLNDIFTTHCKCVSKDKKISKDSGIYSLQFKGNGITQQIGKYLYEDAIIFMPRKKAIFDQILQPIK